LIDVAHRLKKCVCEMDDVGRFGGDEFVVMISPLNIDLSASIL
jgi:PleD family two-component response regulator